jgi:hypothetical protein
MCGLLTGSLIIVRVLEFRQQVEVIESDRLPRWLLFHLRPSQIAVLSFGTVWRIGVTMT